MRDLLEFVDLSLEVGLLLLGLLIGFLCGLLHGSLSNFVLGSDDLFLGIVLLIVRVESIHLDTGNEALWNVTALLWSAGAGRFAVDEAALNGDLLAGREEKCKNHR